MADVQDFLVQARDEFLSSYTTNTIGRSRSSTEAPEDMDWIASFFANPPSLVDPVDEIEALGTAPVATFHRWW